MRWAARHPDMRSAHRTDPTWLTFLLMYRSMWTCSRAAMADAAEARSVLRERYVRRGGGLWPSGTPTARGDHDLQRAASARSRTSSSRSAGCLGCTQPTSRGRRPNPTGFRRRPGTRNRGPAGCLDRPRAAGQASLSAIGPKPCEVPRLEGTQCDDLRAWALAHHRTPAMLLYNTDDPPFRPVGAPVALGGCSVRSVCDQTVSRPRDQRPRQRRHSASPSSPSHPSDRRYQHSCEETGSTRSP